MFGVLGVLRFSAGATLAPVMRAVRRSPTRRIALVFPLGIPCLLAASEPMEALESLATFARESGKDVTIVGGDELLRAHAVAAGLWTATTLDDWHATMPAEPSRLARSKWRRAWARNHAQPTRRLALVRSDELVESADAFKTLETASDPDGAFANDPPDYVRELLALHGRAVDVRPDDGQRRHAATQPRPAGALAYAADDVDELRALSERDEERLTATIRRTSGLGASALSLPWLACAAPSPTAESAESDPSVR
jgi:hypothetical protein